MDHAVLTTALFGSAAALAPIGLTLVVLGSITTRRLVRSTAGLEAFDGITADLARIRKRARSRIIERQAEHEMEVQNGELAVSDKTA